GLRVDGRQTYKTVGEKISAARKARDEALARRSRGEQFEANPRLTFGEAADSWLSTQVADLRPATRASYRNSVEIHLRPQFGGRRLNRITADDWAAFVVKLRKAGKAESSIASILTAARRIYKYAARRMNWHGVQTLALLESRERPKTTAAARHRLFTDQELAQTLAAAWEPFRTLFVFAATTGARMSECLGLVWADIDLTGLDKASVSFEFQASRRGGVRVELKTDESKRVVELPRFLAKMLAAHKIKSAHSQPDAFVFCTRSGKPLGQRNVSRALRRAQKAATDAKGSPTFPILHQKDAGEPVPVPRGAVPCFHSFRHTAASWAIAEGEGAEEISWQLGHKDSTVTRKIYIQEVKSAERSARRREQMEQRYGRIVVAK
ncbi:MAG TPA: site-specific integrase, partial [Solirubrobacterales bacterium]|nr:site-specific integrase [Solirubrobacterales bacterium]